MENGRNNAGKPKNREEFITSISELGKALDRIKLLQLEGRFAEAEKIITMIYRSSLRDPYQKKENTHANLVFDYRSPLGFIVSRRCDKLRNYGLLQRSDYDDVMSEVFLALYTGRLLLGDLEAKEKRLEAARKMGDVKKAEMLEMQLRERREKVRNLSGLNMLANYICFTGSKPGSAGINRIIGGTSVNRRVMGNDGKQNGCLSTEKVYTVSLSTTTIAWKNEELSPYCEERLTFLNIGKVKTQEYLFREELENQEVEAMAQSVVRHVRKRLIRWSMPMREFEVYCLIASETELRKPAFRNNQGLQFPNVNKIMKCLKEDTGVLFGEVEHDLRKKGLISGRIKTALREAKTCWAAVNKARETAAGGCAQDIIIESVAWDVRRRARGWRS